MLVVALLAVAGWIFWPSHNGVTVRVAVAQPVTTAAAASSILDASGYVVARRSATVASKITARMVELDIEEGEHIQAGQIIAGWTIPISAQCSGSLKRN